MINYELIQWIGILIMGVIMLYTAYKLHMENKLPKSFKKP